MDTLDYGTELFFPSLEKVGYTMVFTEVNSGEVLAAVPAYDATVNGKWVANKYKLTFKYENGTVISSDTQTYGTAIAYPPAEKEGNIFVGWRTSENATNITTVPAADAVFYAVFTPRAYRATIMYGGSEVDSKKFLCGEVINLATLSAEILLGLDVRGWYMDANHSVKIEGENVTMPGRDVVLFPDVASNYVEIVFGTGYLGKENISSVFKGYTDGSFVVEKIESFKDETVVIIRFGDVEEAANFMRDVSSGVGDGNNLIKRVSFIEVLCSFLPASAPFSVVAALMSFFMR